MFLFSRVFNYNFFFYFFKIELFKVDFGKKDVVLIVLEIKFEILEVY